jgi:hypothetical protein
MEIFTALVLLLISCFNLLGTMGFCPINHNTIQRGQISPGRKAVGQISPGCKVVVDFGSTAFPTHLAYQNVPFVLASNESYPAIFIREMENIVMASEERTAERIKALGERTEKTVKASEERTEKIVKASEERTEKIVKASEERTSERIKASEKRSEKDFTRVVSEISVLRADFQYLSNDVKRKYDNLLASLANLKTSLESRIANAIDSLDSSIASLKTYSTKMLRAEITKLDKVLRAEISQLEKLRERFFGALERLPPLIQKISSFFFQKKLEN